MQYVYYGLMKSASITEAKNGLSALIDGVKSGSPVLIVDLGRPVARLEPVTRGTGGEDSRLERLVREGVIRPAPGGVPKTLLATEPPHAADGASAVSAPLDDRRSGR